MSGFEKLPNKLVEDTSVSLAGRAVYAVVRHAIWAKTRQEGDTMTAELPPLPELAAAAGCSERALREYVKELRAAGWLTTRRAARGRPQIYTVYAVRRPAESAARVRQNPPDSRARDPYSDLEQDEGRASALPSAARQPNIVFDAVAEATFANATISGGAIGKAVAAIRAAEADEIEERSQRFLAENPTYDEVPKNAIDLWLAERVRERAQQYRLLRPDWELTPTALASHWNRIPTWTPRGAGGGKMSPEQIARLEDR